MKISAPLWRGQVNEGKLKLANPDGFKTYLSSLRGECELILRKWKRRRSGQQNNFYWGVVVPLVCEHTGYTDEEAHEALKFKFLRKKDEREFLPTTRSTAELSTVEFEDYLAKIVLWAGQELQVYIPPPEK
jgi:hypothetical protein